MQCPKCRFNSPDSAIECPRCGIVFSKYNNYLESQDSTKSEENPCQRFCSTLKELFFPLDTESHTLVTIGHGIVFLVLLAWGVRLMLASIESNAVGFSFLHLINLPFHEAGHILFRPFGRFMSVLGGSLLQLIVPLTFLLAFLLKYRNAFGAAVCLWWFGENFLDLAPYINDARAGRLMLLGGVTGRDMPGYHDWEVILGQLGLLEYDHLFATFAKTLGSGIMLLSLVWMGTLLWLSIRDSLD